MRLFVSVVVASSCIAFSPFGCPLPAAGLPQRESNLTIQGNVYLSDEQKPAQHVSVELVSSEGDMIAPETTTESGGFEFHGLAHGSYSIAIDAQGYDRVSVPVDLSFTSSRGIVIYLKASTKGKTEKLGNLVSAHELSMPEKARDLMDSGRRKFYADKDVLGSLEDFQKAAAIAPAYYEAFYQMAVAELTLTKLDDAEKHFRAAIELSSDKYGEAEIGLGTMMLNRGDNAGGEKTIRRGIELSPKNWLGHYELGRALLNENQITEAYKSAEEARRLAPNAPTVYRLLSDIHWRARNYPALLEDLDAYIKLDPNSANGEHAKELRGKVQALADRTKKPSTDTSRQ